MVIEPYILIPSSALAIIIMVLFIRLIAGPRNAHLTENGIREYLSKEETGAQILHMMISRDHKYAFIKLKDDAPLHLVRSFGDKLVMQTLTPQNLKEGNKKISVSRQDISHPALSFEFPADKLSDTWLTILFGPTDVEAK